MECKSVLFKVVEMKVDEVHSFEIGQSVQVSVNGNRFSQKIVSRIEVVKREFDDKANIFIDIFMGNLNLCTVIAREDYILDIYEGSSYKDYVLRKAEDFDYN
ncbi:hypothetical protein [Clostridium cellulovorans]|uniref:Uncharacterized protein n=1 Tax=Clostridium cellulovorans (strain ATCC 35296 / DSM 3052 / OCM 3 / 743B) TaxID=573061 RepID=D9SQ30_CLOC7|nr:hypothetical protein [Clostridium cellulovorans]ADL52166.1 hypothetical protein Clocel_2453 [Clostridium cellulovorans 743B]